MDKALKLHIEDTKELIHDINYRCALLGLKAVNPRTGQQKMKCWLPDEIRDLLVVEYLRSEDEKTGIALIKYFGGSGTWWFSEYDPKTQQFYGKAEIQFKELGYTSLDELRGLRLPMGLWIERDFWFEPKPLEEC